MTTKRPTAAPEGARYTGDGTQFLSGVPARDLTPEEWADLPDALRAVALATGLYVTAAATAPAGASETPSN